MDASERETRVRELRAQGHSQNAIARLSGIPRRTVQRIIQRLEQEPPQTPVSSGEGPQTLTLHPVAPRDAPPPWAQPRPSDELGRGQSDTPTTPSSERPQEPGPPLIEGRHEDAAEVRAETTAPPPKVDALPQMAQQLHDAALRISQVEAQQLRDAEARARQAEEALPQALQALQAVRAEQGRMIRDMMQSVGELLQATGQLLQLLQGRVPQG